MRRNHIGALWGGIVLAATVAAFAPATGLAAEKKAAAKAVPLETENPAAVRPWQRIKQDPQGVNWPQTNWVNYNTLAYFSTQPPGALQKLENPVNGDAAKGKKLVADRSKGGSCLACHIIADAGGQPGNVGPDLSQIGAQRDDQWLYNYVYDARVYNKDSIMPPWGAHGVLTTAEIKDVVAYLKTLKTPYAFKNPSEDPNKRTAPVETRNNLDPTENPGMFGLDRGMELFRAKGPNGKSCASCHADPKKAFRTWAGSMPKWEPRLEKVLGIEEFVTRHGRATTGMNILMETEDNIGMSIYLRNLANGTPIKVDTQSPAAKAALKRADELMKRKVGQLNMSCFDCHSTDRHANKWARGQYLVDMKQGLVSHFPTFRTARGDIWNIRKRFMWCNVSVRGNEVPPDAAQYGDIELYLTALANGQKINSPGIRH